MLVVLCPSGRQLLWLTISNAPEIPEVSRLILWGIVEPARSVIFKEALPQKTVGNKEGRVP